MNVGYSSMGSLTIKFWQYWNNPSVTISECTSNYFNPTYDFLSWNIKLLQILINTILWKRGRSYFISCPVPCGNSEISTKYFLRYQSWYNEHLFLSSLWQRRQCDNYVLLQKHTIGKINGPNIFWNCRILQLIVPLPPLLSVEIIIASPWET